MAVSYTVTDAQSEGAMRRVSGTFTSADGDGVAESGLNASVHGLNYIADVRVNLEAFTAPIKVSVSAGTVTWDCENTKGASGRFSVLGR